jgi:hypothetical protein
VGVWGISTAVLNDVCGSSSQLVLLTSHLYASKSSKIGSTVKIARDNAT